MTNTYPDVKLDKRSALIIAGPTASGKSGLAMQLARDLDGVVINADSQQIYKGLPILSAQPCLGDMEEIDHRLYSFLDPHEICDAHRWRELAKFEIEKALEDEKIPILVGGTGLYINALVDGLSPVPDIPDDIRQNVANYVEERGASEAFKNLQGKDPASAAKIDPSNKRRIARALEVLEATDKSLSVWQKAPKEGAPEDISFYMIVVMTDREELKTRCNDRFDWMIEQGAFEEIKTLASLIKQGRLDDFTPVTKALGFRPLQAYLNGEFNWQDAIEMAKAETRQYAKRQVTWFRHQCPENLKSKHVWQPGDEAPPTVIRERTKL